MLCRKQTFKLLQQLPQVFVLFLLSIFFSAYPSEAMAQEDRCRALGPNCLCSDTLNAPGPLLKAGPSWAWYVNDGGTKRCSYDGGGGPISRNEVNINDIFQANTGSILSALPTGHSVSWIHRSISKINSIWSLAHKISDSVTHVRRAERHYMYISPDFQFTADGCAGNSGKIMAFQVDLGPYFSVQNVNAGWTFANWGSSGWSGHNPNCCVAPPGGDPIGRSVLTPAYMRGKWIRMENIIINEGGTPVVLKSYWKDVTNNGPEYLMLDTSVPTTMPDGQHWTLANATSLKETGTQGRLGVEFFRTGSCPGYFAISHLMYAAWNTNSGQRIGGATEIEGQGVNQNRLMAPLNLRVFPF